MAVLLAAVAIVATGCIEFEVQKQVTNGTSTGPFVVNITCDDGTPESEDLTFDALDPSGQQTLTSIEFDTNAVGTTTCTVTEPEDAGATTVTIECLVPLPASVTCTPPGSTLTVTVTDPGSSSVGVNLRVTNDFTGVTTTTTTTTTTSTPPPPTTTAPAPVIVAPAFTG